MHRCSTTLFRAAFTGALVLTLGAASAMAADRDRDREWDEGFDYTWTLSRGQTLDVRGLNGSIQVRPSNTRTARVVARKSSGRRCDPSDVRIEANETRDGIMVCALWPTRNGRENECGGNPSNDNCDVEVEFVVEVPAGVIFQGQTVNGDVKAEALHGPAKLTTVNGSIWVETTSWASAETVNGSIHASLGAESWDGDLSFETVNGGIHIELPRDVDADVYGQFMNGSFDSDFPLRVRGRMGPRSVRGTLGDGGSGLELSTTNGDVVVRSHS